MSLVTEKKYTPEQYKVQADAILQKYPDRIPVIVEKAKNSDIVEMDKKKFLVPKDLTVGQFVYVIRKRIRLSSEQAIFIFINGTLPATSSLMSKVYEDHKDQSGFLMVVYSGESTFGGTAL